ncbi:MAG: hypothetical protein ICV75_06890 [Nitrospiraceae bacterium]|nr:hypothetical protein [Nitrospiraceae bacterium]
MAELGVQTDICETVSPGEPALALHPQLVTFAHCNPSPLFILNAEAGLIYCNHAARRTQQDLGLVGQDILTLLPADFPDIVRECLTSDAKPRRLENEVHSRWFGWTAYRLPKIDVVYFFGADITKYKDAEKEQNELRLRLIQNDKMASIGQLAAGIAHEINNPLSFVVLNFNHIMKYCTDLLALVQQYAAVEETLRAAGPASSHGEALAQLAAVKQQMELDEVLEELPSLLEESKDGAERIRSIVQNLKEFSHTTEGARKHADVNRCLQSTLKIVAYELKYKAKVIEEYGAIPEISCYPQELNQVFMNLLVNAGHSIKERGEIRVSTCVQAGHIVVQISDTGCGIPAEHLPRIFQTFFTTKEVGKGTGLGLSISADIVKKHQGRIEVTSTVGVGTTFHVWLPLHGGAEPRP